MTSDVVQIFTTRFYDQLKIVKDVKIFLKSSNGKWSVGTLLIKKFLFRARPVTARYDPYPLPPISSRRPAVDPYETYAYSSQSSPSRGASSGDSFARDLLELYIKNRAAFDAYANDPLVRKALNLPPVESDPVYYRTPPPPSSGRDYYERRRYDSANCDTFYINLHCQYL